MSTETSKQYVNLKTGIVAEFHAQHEVEIKGRDIDCVLYSVNDSLHTMPAAKFYRHYVERSRVHNFNEFRFRKNDEIICPLCKEISLAQEDIPFSQQRRMVMCDKCRGVSRYKRWLKVEK